jgi:hypothetical protein
MSDTLDRPAPHHSGPPPLAAPIPGAAHSRGRGAWWWSGLRPLVLRLHLYVGLFVGPFLLVAAVPDWRTP